MSLPYEILQERLPLRALSIPLALRCVPGGVEVILAGESRHLTNKAFRRLSLGKQGGIVRSLAQLNTALVAVGDRL
jgi:hypothetical protein